MRLERVLIRRRRRALWDPGRRRSSRRRIHRGSRRDGRGHARWIIQRLLRFKPLPTHPIPRPTARTRILIVRPQIAGASVGISTPNRCVRAPSIRVVDVIEGHALFADGLVCSLLGSHTPHGGFGGPFVLLGGPSAAEAEGADDDPNSEDDGCYA
jgi:hypothetical protein